MSYLSGRCADLEDEIAQSDQAGSWDERDHLHEELGEVKTLLDLLQAMDGAD